MRKITYTISFVFLVCLLFFLVSFKSAIPESTKYHKLMYSGGIVGQSVGGCTCHGPTPTPSVNVSISGMPASPIINVTYPLVFTVSGPNPYAGFNIAVNSGTLVNSDGDSQVLGGELTHTTPKALSHGATTFAFDWTPTSAGNATFTFAGNNVDLGGSSGGDFWNNGTLTIPVQTLPVKISALNGVSINNTTNTVFWKAEQEMNFAKYIIEYSCNGLNFTPVGTVLPQTATSYSKNYEFTHTNISCANAKSFYRLKLINLDASFEYSSIITITKNSKDLAATLYPNPVLNIKDKLTVNTGNRKVNTIQLFDANGKRIGTYNNINKVVNELQLPSDLKHGMYFITVFYQNKTKSSLSFVY